MIDRTLMEFLVQKGIWAPSGDNLQPWKFLLRDNSIDLYLDRERCSEIFNVGYRGAYLSAGAVIENMALAASHKGYTVSVRYFPTGESITSPVAILKIDSSNTKEDSLYPFVESRSTNRKFYKNKPVPENTLRELQKIGDVPGRFRLIHIPSGEKKRQLAKIIGAADQIRFENKLFHQAFFHILRFTRQEAEHHRDGLDLRAIEVGPAAYPTFRLISNWARLNALNKIGLSRFFNFYAASQTDKSPLLGLLVSETNSPIDYVEGGRIMQRLFLKISEAGLALQPMTAPLIFILFLQLTGGKEFTPRQRLKAEAIKKDFFHLFQLNDHNGLLMLFRFGFAPPPTCRSLRRPVPDFFITESSR